MLLTRIRHEFSLVTHQTISKKITNHGLAHTIAEAQPRYCYSETEHVINVLGLNKLSTNLY
jgi:hypothetical protein